MSNGANAALALALGAGGGFLAWHLTHKDKEKPGGGGAPATVEAPIAPAAPSAPTAPAVSAAPPRVAGACSLKLDTSGLTADGERVDVPTAVTRCKPSGKAELALASAAPAAVYLELAKALQAAAVPLTVKAA